MNVPALLRTQIETRIPAAFHVISRPEPKYLQTGIGSIDDLVGGVPLSALTEVYGYWHIPRKSISVRSSMPAIRLILRQHC
jgi:hypothetical protein